MHAPGFIIQTFDPFAHNEGGSDAKEDGTADTQAQDPRVQRGGVYPSPQVKCGTPENPILDTVFTDKLDVSSSHMAVYRSCEWQQKCVFPTTSSAPPLEIEEGSSSSSSSSSSS